MCLLFWSFGFKSFNLLGRINCFSLILRVLRYFCGFLNLVSVFGICRGCVNLKND